MKISDEGSEPLHDILKAASSEQGATLLVPDLQRPYVWTPSQVTLLIDSLLRGWPFGTLLLWKVHKEELAGIPSRPFWRVRAVGAPGLQPRLTNRPPWTPLRPPAGCLANRVKTLFHSSFASQIGDRLCADAYAPKQQTSVQRDGRVPRHGSS